MKFKFSSLYLNIGLLGLLVFSISGVILTSFAFKVNAASPSSILVSVVPENPAPNEDTTINLNSYANNLDSVLITWTVNGKIALSGIGRKSFSLKAPSVGGETDIVATVSLPDGAIDTRIVLRPAVMVLLYQAMDSYVPPFYRGKAMPTPGSEIKVVAMPEIKAASGMVDPRNMTYAWKQDYTNNVDGSGYGKNSFTYINDYLESSNNINVTASTVDQQYSSDASLDIGTTEPKILFYKNDPNLGTLWEEAIGDGHRIQGDEIIKAAPYFISPADIRIPTLTFNWFINNYQIDVPISKKDLMPVQVQGGASGTSVIKLDIESSDKIYESASREINVEF